jgi:hypothetical protein
MKALYQNQRYDAAVFEYSQNSVFHAIRSANPMAQHYAGLTVSKNFWLSSWMTIDRERQYEPQSEMGGGKPGKPEWIWNSDESSQPHKRV